MQVRAGRHHRVRKDTERGYTIGVFVIGNRWAIVQSVHVYVLD